MEVQSWAPSQQAFPSLPLGCWHPQVLTIEKGDRSLSGGQERGNSSSPWGSRAGILPGEPTPHPLTSLPQRGAGREREGEAGLKLRSHKQVRDVAGRPGPSAAGAVPTWTSAAPWKDVRSALAPLTTDRGGGAASGPALPHATCPSNQLGWKHEPRQQFPELCDSLGQPAPVLIM